MHKGARKRKINEAHKVRAPRLDQKPREAPKSPRLKNGLHLTLFKAQQCAPRAFVPLGAPRAAANQRLDQNQATLEHLLEELWELQKLVTVTDGAPVSMAHIITALTYTESQPGLQAPILTWAQLREALTVNRTRFSSNYVTAAIAPALQYRDRGSSSKEVEPIAIRASNSINNE
ncbi:hypothetical protein Cgig2_014896 [Carnegiea gigantea]|uniref:Uncharacterized protein n=1 Tax=Carnegiea gigantea TaxID=171969 RepID=A0A9Q1GNP5_9CARY|nr:hypothetical protein Cgig2_014896 [Carnegiea gigantea]